VSKVGSILELPFHEWPALELLGFDPEGRREAVNTEDTRFGWCRPSRVWLHATAADGRGAGDGVAPGPALVEVRRPLVLALHSADDGPALADDVVLEFALADGAVAAPLSLFLERWLPRLAAEHRQRCGAADAAPIVLALCNPHRARLAAPAAAAGRALFYAAGDVDSWLDPVATPGMLEGAEEEEARARIRLAAAAWRRAEAAG
jgi:hypothetical protein